MSPVILHKILILSDFSELCFLYIVQYQEIFYELFLFGEELSYIKAIGIVLDQIIGISTIVATSWR